MSQVSIIDIEGNNPQIPTEFIANIGSAVPLANILEILGDTVPAGVLPVYTEASGNTVTVNVQIAQAIAASNALNVGLAAFDSSVFSVDANGFVTLGPVFAETITGNTGGALSPVAGNWNIFGAIVAAGSTPVATSGVGNTLTVNIQRSQAIPATDATKAGLASFSSSAFSVDANGFVQLVGGGIASTSFDVQANTAPGTDPVVPTGAGLVTVNGAAVANHSVVLETRSRAANAYNIEIQYATSAAATDATKSGVAHFNSAQFSVDANGFVSTSGTGVLNTLTGNSGGAIPPTAGNINTLGTGSITIAGAGSTLTTQLTGLTNHAVLVGAGTATITKVGPTATVGQVLQSAGPSADPAFSTATYPLTTTINEILYSSSANTVVGLTTANNGVLITSATGVPSFLANGTTGQLLTATTGSPPSWQTPTVLVTTWTDVSGSVTAVSGNGYFAIGTTTSTLPASPNQGDIIRYVVDTTNLLTIQAAGSQVIRIGTTVSAAGGTCVNTQRGDAIELVYRSTGTAWIAANNPVGGWNIT